jgi:hypothetical protein
MSVSEPLSECVVVPSEPLVDRVQYLAARASTFTDMVKRGAAELDAHTAPTSICPERMSGAAIVMSLPPAPAVATVARNRLPIGSQNGIGPSAYVPRSSEGDVALRWCATSMKGRKYRNPTGSEIATSSRPVSPSSYPAKARAALAE